VLGFETEFSFCGTRVWTQGFHLEPLYQPYFCEGFFWDRVSRTVCPGGLRTAILLISASWVARITGVSHQCPAGIFFFFTFFSTRGWAQSLDLARQALLPLKPRLDLRGNFLLSHSREHTGLYVGPLPIFSIAHSLIQATIISPKWSSSFKPWLWSAQQSVRLFKIEVHAGWVA
jgi:hypothetical protein